MTRRPRLPRVRPGPRASASGPIRTAASAAAAASETSAESGGARERVHSLRADRPSQQALLRAGRARSHGRGVRRAHGGAARARDLASRAADPRLSDTACRLRAFVALREGPALRCRCCRWEMPSAKKTSPTSSIASASSCACRRKTKWSSPSNRRSTACRCRCATSTASWSKPRHVGMVTKVRTSPRTSAR